VARRRRSNLPPAPDRGSKPAARHVSEASFTNFTVGWRAAAAALLMRHDRLTPTRARPRGPTETT